MSDEQLPADWNEAAERRRARIWASQLAPQFRADYARQCILAGLIIVPVFLAIMVGAFFIMLANGWIGR